MVNTRLILERMREVGVSRADIADSLELAKPTVSQKLRNIRPMFLDEAEKICVLLKIEASDFGMYFFLHETTTTTKDEDREVEHEAQVYQRAGE